MSARSLDSRNSRTGTSRDNTSRQQTDISGSDESLRTLKKRTAALNKLLRPFAGPSRHSGATFVESLVSTILSQNTSDVNSHRAYIQLRATYPTWEEVANAEPEELAEVIRSGGLAAQKSRTIIASLNAIRDRYNSFEPQHFDDVDDDTLLDELTSMKGVGVKTAACVLLFSLGRDVCAVDTHIHRICNRLRLVNTSNAEQTFHQLRPLIPRGEAMNFHLGMIRFGRRICKAQRPHCFECTLFDLCRFEHKDAFAAEAIPGPKSASGDLVLSDLLRRR